MSDLKGWFTQKCTLMPFKPCMTVCLSLDNKTKTTKTKLVLLERTPSNKVAAVLADIQTDKKQLAHQQFLIG